MDGERQLRLLLWKDYLMRKRKLITLAGVIWAAAVMMSLHIVRINVNNEEYPTCGFPARALPSAGMLPFLQSFMCSINNECKPLDQFDEIPDYENSKLTQLSRRLAPILNDSTLDVASSVPDALRLLATLAEVVDEPTFVNISKNGLYVKDLFTKPSRVKRFVEEKLELNNNVTDGLMNAQLSFQGLLKGSINRCSAESLSNTLILKNSEHLNKLAEKLCSKSMEELQKIVIDLLFEIDYSKYMTMLGDMYYKLSGDKRIITLGDMITAVLRMINVHSFLPPEVVSIFKGNTLDFSYIQLNLIPKLLDQFQPTFGDTQSYGIIRDFADTLVIGLQYLDKLFIKIRAKEGDSVDNVNTTDAVSGIQSVSKLLHHATDVIGEALQNDTSFDAFNAMSQVTNFVTKLLPANTKHDVLFYSTLLSKLIESAYRVIDINMHIEELTYNVTLRHTDAVKLLKTLKPEVIANAFEALANAERTQMLTSKIAAPNKMFCDVKQVKTFFNMTNQAEVESLKKQLCTDVWKNYVTDLIQSFGVFEVRNNINHMASLLIQETLGKDTSSQLYTIERDFQILRNFTHALTRMNTEPKPEVDWGLLFDVSPNSDFLKILHEKGHLGKQMLIVVHGALAKEIVQQNPILDFKLSPYLDDVIVLTSGINEQLDLVSDDDAEQFRDLYPSIVKTILMTALNEVKTYKSLSTPGVDILCNDLDNAAEYLELPTDGAEAQSTVDALCKATIFIKNGLQADSAVTKAIKNITSSSSSRSILGIDWNKLINNLKTLYVRLDVHYPYVFEFSHYGMDKNMKEKVDELFKEAKRYWFDARKMERSLHLSIKLGLRFLDLLDNDLFGVRGEYWMRIKHVISAAAGPVQVLDETVHLVTALITNRTYEGDLPPTTVAALTTIIPNIPQLIVDAMDIVVADDTDIQSIISVLNADPPWPCSTTSLSSLLVLSSTSKDAVRSLETMLCMDEDFQQEWVLYLVVKNASVSAAATPWNRTDYAPHLFLTLSSMLDAFVDDFKMSRDALDLVLKDSESGRLGMKEAWRYAVDALNTTDRHLILRKLFTKMDLVLNSVNTSSTPDDVPASRLWEGFVRCSKEYIDVECRLLGRKAWKYFFSSVSVILENIAQDLLRYFKEINEPDSNLLQLLGFTRDTGLYILYDKMSEFVGVLLNSYWDYGFMSQIRRASLSQFWECEAVMQSLVAPPGSAIDSGAVRLVTPLVCPSLLHWLSLPRGENALLDVFSKPQYFFYTLQVQNITSRYESAYTKAVELTDYITEVSKKNRTIITENDIKMNTLQDKLNNIVDTVLTYKIDENDIKYRTFSEINVKQFATNIYLTRILAIVNKLDEYINKIDVNTFKGAEEEIKKLEADLKIIKYLFKRRPVDAISIHFDVITDVLVNNRKDYTIVDGFKSICSDIQGNSSKTILIANTKAIGQVCGKRYEEIYGAVQENVVEDYDDARNSLMNLVRMMQGDDNDVNDVVQFLRERTQLIASLTQSVKHSYDLSIPIFLKYQQSNIQSYSIILSFLSGEDWWKAVRTVYNGPYAAKFFTYVENSFSVAEELMTNFEDVHLVRLLRDINTNETESFCQPNLTLSDYLPDSTGMLSDLKAQLCAEDKTELYKELPPLLYTSLGYETSIQISKEVDYTRLNEDLSSIESRLGPLSSGPKAPVPPSWVTEEKVQHLRKVAQGLLSKQSLTKAAFAVISNGVDAGTLYLNNSQCTLCSQLTSWLKQLNLQLFKKQEYDSLLCHLQPMALEDVHHTLKNDFHWDMAIRELISTRNYTALELNKSLQEFLGHVRLYLLEDLGEKASKLADCLARNVSRNALGNATLFASVLSHTSKLIRAELPHIHEVEGIKSLPYLKQLYKEIAHNIDVQRPLAEYLVLNNKLHEQLNEIDLDLANDIESGDINLRKVRSLSNSLEDIVLPKGNWQIICNRYNCSEIASIVTKNINMSLVDKTLPEYQQDEFWRFGFISPIMSHAEGLVSHGARLLGVASQLDLPGLMEGRVDALTDTAMLLINDDILDSILYSLQGMVSELAPVLNGTTLEHDLKALSSGLDVLRQIKDYLLDEVDLKLEVKQLFLNPESIESGLSELGINNTNFWSLAAPRIHAGHVMLKPLLNSKQPNTHISTYVCQIDAMSKVLDPSNLDVVTADDVFAAVVEQFCGVSDGVAKQVLTVLMQNFNYSLVFDQVKDTLLNKLYSASNLTSEQGTAVVSKYSQMAALAPAVQNNVDYVTELFNDEPMFQGLRDFSSVGNLLSSSEFLSSAGNIMCGAPFSMNTNRFYKQITSTQDLSKAPDQAQLDVLPTDFCRSLYLDIISVEGGKIVWSFVKPLIMGKILYTPPTAQATRIVEQANSTFASMIKMTNLVHSFAKSFSSVNKLSSHREGVGVLRAVMTDPQFSAIRAMIMGDDDQAQGEVPDLDVEGIFDKFGDIEGIGSLLSKASELLQCINLNRFQASPSEPDLMHEAAVLTNVNEFSAGIVFLNSEGRGSSLSNVEYKIRMDVDNAPTTKRLRDYLWIPGPESSFIENMRYFRGFVQIQDLVDSAIIRLAANETDAPRDDDWAMYTQQTPYPCYTKDFFQTSLYESQSLIVAFFFSLLFTVASTIRFIVSDKETGNTMLMSVMGVDLRWHTLSWFIASFIEMVLTMACITVILCAGAILPTTDPSLVFVLLLIFGLAVLSFCYMLSKLFSMASLAAVCGAVSYLVTFMPFVIILSLEAVLYSPLKMLICLSMSSSLCYAFLFITRYEARGSGAGWGQLWEAPGDSDDMSIGLAAAMMLLDAAIYLLIGWLVDRYYGIKTIKSNITHCTATDEKAGVSIINVCKEYQPGSRRRKVALDHVSVELQQGQVTALLGHNGAGKTTLINILTGMLRPTSGHVIVRSPRGGTRLGVCPQHDVLWDCLSAREHVALYAQLNCGLPKEQVEEEVDKMLSVLSLGEYSSQSVSSLSGGTRRRVCVALAFIGRPHLVSLDEPTAGVDPAARRDIWSMIVKLKEDRTILLTTHHLDEAELLSDQIVIMHKGQIHTTGSPIEIKRTLGNGYKLTVFYPERQPEDCVEDSSQEEKTKQLLTVVRDVVKNANVVDVNGLEVELALPFFDANGLNNNFLQLCRVLESSQAALGFRSYSMDCSSLEQVFFNVCQHADHPNPAIEYVSESSPSKSASSSSIRTDRSRQLVPPEGPLKGGAWEQFSALVYARYIHHIRNRWLLFMLVGLPSLFVAIAMGFSTLRPPADNEIALALDRNLYANTTQFIVPRPSIYSDDLDPSFAERVMNHLMMDRHIKNWTTEDSPHCECSSRRQVCDVIANATLPDMMSLPDVTTLNQWLVDTQEMYIEKRYIGYSSVVKHNKTRLVSWYNNKGHHAMVAALNAINNAVLRARTRSNNASITTYTHPLKISQEQLSKATVYQHIADAGISGLVLIAYALVSGGAAMYLVSSRSRREKRLQLLCGVTPLMYWTTALAWDMMIMVINMGITAIVMAAFGFPVFVARNNLPAICLLFILYGYACGSLVHVAEKLFREASMANMVLFCGNAFLGLSFIAILLIFDIISESQATDNARYVLHKVFMVSPQFALGDGLLEIAKNTIQAQVLGRFGMDTYQDPLGSDLIALHYCYLLLVGTALMLLNLAIEYDCFGTLLARCRTESVPSASGEELEPLDVSEERKRVHSSRLQAEHAPLRVNTIGNINRGFVLSEGPKKSMQRVVEPLSDAAQCVAVSKAYRTARGSRLALRNLTLGIPHRQCTALLGENGAGKSTTFALLTGETSPSSGQLFLNNKPVSSTQLCTGLISYCPQSDAIDPLLTVTETLRFYCKLRGIADHEQVISRTLEMFDLEKYAWVRSGALSGGNKRKLCSAVAFMARTPLVLLDEPTSGMDPWSRACVSRGVAAARASRAVLLSTHALHDARRLAARVALLRHGQLVALGSLDDCLTRFGGGYVVQCRASRANARAAWHALKQRAPHAALRVLHQRSLHALVPTTHIVDNKQVTTRLSDIFRLMAELQATCDIEDYTINQSSLEQMFLSFTESPAEAEDVEIEPLPSTPADIQRCDELDTVTAL